MTYIDMSVHWPTCSTFIVTNLTFKRFLSSMCSDMTSHRPTVVWEIIAHIAHELVSVWIGARHVRAGFTMRNLWVSIRGQDHVTIDTKGLKTVFCVRTDRIILKGIWWERRRYSDALLKYKCHLHVWSFGF